MEVSKPDLKWLIKCKIKGQIGTAFMLWNLVRNGETIYVNILNFHILLLYIIEIQPYENFKLVKFWFEKAQKSIY